MVVQQWIRNQRSFSVFLGYKSELEGKRSVSLLFTDIKTESQIFKGSFQLSCQLFLSQQSLNFKNIGIHFKKYHN